MDGLVADSNVRISVVATTSRPSVLDPALRRAGRLDKEIEIRKKIIYAMKVIYDMVIWNIYLI